MRLPPLPHRWNLTPAEAIALQRELAARVRIEPPPGPLRFVAGVDAAFSPDGRQCLAGVVLWDLETGAVCEEHVAAARLRFPYIPGLLSFREAPAILAALRRLRRLPDALLCDGQGLAHPRRFGIACHLGVLLDLPAAGCAKSLLTGTHEPPGRHRGDRAALRDGDQIIGAVLRTRDDVRPVYVSVGHRMTLEGAVELVLRCGRGRRLPEPTRLADRLVAAAKRARFPKGGGSLRA